MVAAGFDLAEFSWQIKRHLLAEPGEDAPVANKLLGVAWLVALIALFFASDYPLVRGSWLSRITYYGKLSSLSKTQDVRPERSDTNSRGMLSYLYLRSATAWTSFYALAVVWNSVCLAHFALVVPAPPAEVRVLGVFQPAALTMLIMQPHLIRRLVECLFVTRFSNRALHPLNAVAGLGFYLLLCPTLHNVAVHEASFSTGTQPPVWPMAVGGTLVVACNVLQAMCHLHLASLKNTASKRRFAGRAVVHVGNYTFPSNWAFRHVSCCPHYTFEIGVYVGVLLMARAASMAWFPLAFAICNLSLSASRTFTWYAAKFGRTPSQWKIMPFIY